MCLPMHACEFTAVPCRGEGNTEREGNTEGEDTGFDSINGTLFFPLLLFAVLIPKTLWFILKKMRVTQVYALESLIKQGPGARQ